MRFHPTRVHKLNLCLSLILFLIVFACTKDSDILQEADFSNEVLQVDEESNSEEEESEEEQEEEAEEETTEETEEETTEEETTEDEESTTEEVFESRTTVFIPSQDAYVQNGQGFNYDLIRVDNGLRTSYLQFDLSAIDSIGGAITNVELRFTVNADGGNGQIDIHKGTGNDWSEDALDESNAPVVDVNVGSVNKDYQVGTVHDILLSAENITASKTTLILTHGEGDDLAFASKEHPSVDGPKLIVTYDAPESAPEVVTDETVEGSGGSGGQEESNGEEESTEETTEENTAPTARIGANPVSGSAPLVVSFTGNTSSDDKGISSYLWDFKDGNTATSTNPSHTFTDAGTYAVTLRVTDEEGLSDITTVTITVENQTENEEPVAVANASPDTGNAPLEVQFIANNSTDDKEITGYSWDFGNGQSTSNKNPSYTYNTAGVYEATLTVTDAEGLTSSDSVTITVTEGGSGGSGGGGGGGGGGGAPAGGVKASTFGYNSSNATAAIKAAINSSHSVIIVDRQSSDWIVEPLTFKNLRNKTIYFEPGVVLRAKSGAFPNTSHRLFQLIDCDNIEVLGYDATFRMNKPEYQDGQQRHAFAIVRSSNITVKGLTLRDSGGDGIYLSRFNPGEYNRNILIEDIAAINNARQGMSVISVDGLTIRNSTFTGTTGESPGAGIDFEPDFIQDRMTNIVVENCSFTNNWGPGILFALTYTASSTVPIDVTFRNVYLSNNFATSNPGPYKSEISLGMSTSSIHNPIRGQITFDGLTVENSRYSAIYTKKTLEAYSVTVRNAVLRNLSTGSNFPVIHMGVLDYANSSTANMGGFTFQNVLIDYDGNDPSVELHGPTNKSFLTREMYGQIRVRSPRGVRLKDDLGLLNTNHSSVTLEVVSD